MSWILKWFHVDWAACKALLTVSIRMDFRAQSTQSGGKRRMAPMVRGAVFYGIMGCSLAASLAARATPFLYSFLTIAYSMAMMAFAVILEFGNTIINPDDVDVLAHRPINEQTYFTAKAGNLLFYILLLGSSLCLFPALIGMMVKGNTSVFPLVFYPVAMAANLTSASLIVLLYTALMRIVPGEKFKDLLAVLQIAFSFAVFLAYQYIPRMSQGFLQSGQDLANSWLYAAPPAWFAGVVTYFLGYGRFIDIGLSWMALASMILVVFFSFRRISLGYAEQLSRLNNAEEEPRKYKTKSHPKLSFETRGLFRRGLSSGLVLTGYRLTVALLKKDRTVKTGVYPVFGFPLAFLVLAMVEGEIVDPFVQRSLFGQGSVSSMMVFFIFFMVYFFVMAMTTIRDWEAAWIFHSAPVSSPSRLYRGVKLAIMLWLIAPFFVVLGVLLCTQMPLGHGLMHTVMLWVMAMVASAVGSFFVRSYPFSKKREKGERIQRYAFLIFVAPFFILMGAVQYWIYRSNTLFLIWLLLMLIVFIGLEILSGQRLDRVLGRAEFEA